MHKRKDFCKEIWERYEGLKKKKNKTKDSFKKKAGSLSEEEISGLRKDIIEMKAEAFKILKDLYCHESLEDVEAYFDSGVVSSEDKEKSLYGFLYIYHFYTGDTNEFMRKIINLRNRADFYTSEHTVVENYLNRSSDFDLVDRAEGLRTGKLRTGLHPSTAPTSFYSGYKHLKGVADYLRYGKTKDWDFFNEAIEKSKERRKGKSLQKERLVEFLTKFRDNIIEKITNNESTNKENVDKIYNYFINTEEKFYFNQFTHFIFILSKVEPDLLDFGKIKNCLNNFMKLRERARKDVMLVQYYSVLSEMMIGLGEEKMNKIIKEINSTSERGPSETIGLNTLLIEDSERGCLSFLQYYQGRFKEAKRFPPPDDDKQIYMIELSLALDNPRKYMQDVQANNIIGPHVSQRDAIYNILLSGYYERKIRELQGSKDDR